MADKNIKLQARLEKLRCNRVECSMPLRETEEQLRPSNADKLFQEAVSRCERFLDNRDAAANVLDFNEVPVLLREVFDADFERYCGISRPAGTAQKLTCLRPSVIDFEADNLHSMFGELSSDGLMAVPLTEGRVCIDGSCGDKCSRLAVPNFATQAECEEMCLFADAMISNSQNNKDKEDRVPLTQLTLAEWAFEHSPRAMLLFVRLVERLRRAVAVEYSLPLASVAPHTALVSQWTKVGGCPGTPVHGDEAACTGFHYSTILQLSTQGEGFEGGDFVFSDQLTAGRICEGAGAPFTEAVTELGNGGAADEKSTAGRLLTRFSPRQGRALIFSSGWENLHFVDNITSGVRYAMPAFFLTHSDWAVHQESVAQQDVLNALLMFVLGAETDEDRGQFTKLWHSIFAAPLVDT